MSVWRREWPARKSRPIHHVHVCGDSAEVMAYRKLKRDHQNTFSSLSPVSVRSSGWWMHLSGKREIFIFTGAKWGSNTTAIITDKSFLYCSIHGGSPQGRAAPEQQTRLLKGRFVGVLGHMCLTWNVVLVCLSNKIIPWPCLEKLSCNTWDTCDIYSHYEMGAF